MYTVGCTVATRGGSIPRVDPAELTELRRIAAALDAEDARHRQAMAELRRRRGAEVRRLRALPPAGLGRSHGQIANALGVSRGAIQQWENVT